MTQTYAGPPELSEPDSLEAAVAELAGLGDEGAVLAGGTWVLRAPLRGERLRRRYVSLRRVPGLAGQEAGDPTVLGALTTHAQLAALDAGGALGAVVEAAAASSFPAVRNVATLAGNLCTSGVPAADLVPALLALEAELDVVTQHRTERVTVVDYLSTRTSRPAGEVVARVFVPAPAGRRSAYERLALRAGDYPVAAVALSVDLDGSVVRDVRVAIGAVEEAPRRAAAAEGVLRGKPLGRDAAEAAGRAAAGELTGRDAFDAPGWYRLAVLPELFARVAERLA